MTDLPKLLDRKQIASELGVKLATAEAIMRDCPKITVGRRVYVTDAALATYLKKKEAA